MCDSNYQKLCVLEDCKKCFERSFASHEKSQYWSDKNKIKPRNILKNSNKKFYFNCNECNHELVIRINNITSSNNSWCKYCSKCELCDDDNCKICFEKSFANHPMSFSWSSINDFSPRKVALGSEKKCWFDCQDCKHSFDRVLYSINLEKVCPYCANQRLCNNDCNLCFSKSLASLNIKSKWSSKNILTTRQVFKGSNNNFIFNCNKCNHEFKTTPNHFTNRNCSSCPYCANHILCKDDKCKICFDKSFASHELAVKCWNIKNKCKPREIFIGTGKKLIFNCDRCNGEF